MCSSSSFDVEGIRRGGVEGMTRGEGREFLWGLKMVEEVRRTMRTVGDLFAPPFLWKRRVR